MGYWKKLQRKLYTARRLSRTECCLVAQASCSLVWLRCALPLLGFRRCLQSYGADQVAEQRATDERGINMVAMKLEEAEAEQWKEVTKRICKCVRIAIRNTPLKPNCLRSSLVLLRLLRSHRVDAALRIGVRRADDKIEAHAWVESRGVILNDQPSVVHSYHCFPDQQVCWNSFAEGASWR